VFFSYIFQTLPNPPLPTKIQVERIEIDFLIVVFALKILSVGFDDIESLSSGSFMGVILQLFADAYLIESIEVDMAE
jgi:hypothetical protein